MKNNTKKYHIGIDEVGRGPLAGPVSVGVFCIERTLSSKIKNRLKGITDSKKLSEIKRQEYYKCIKSIEKEGLLSFSYNTVSPQVIDKKGIVYSINLALERGLKKLNIVPSEAYVYLDGGLHAPKVYEQETIIKGDQKNWLIGAASVLAKVLRDEQMLKYHEKFGNYGFNNHKGYGTREHRENIKKFGPCSIHRKTWIN